MSHLDTILQGRINSEGQASGEQDSYAHAVMPGGIVEGIISHTTQVERQGEGRRLDPQPVAEPSSASSAAKRPRKIASR